LYSFYQACAAEQHVEALPREAAHLVLVLLEGIHEPAALFGQTGLSAAFAAVPPQSPRPQNRIPCRMPPVVVFPIISRRDENRQALFELQLALLFNVCLLQFLFFK